MGNSARKGLRSARPQSSSTKNKQSFFSEKPLHRVARVCAGLRKVASTPPPSGGPWTGLEGFGELWTVLTILGCLSRILTTEPPPVLRSIATEGERHKGQTMPGSQGPAELEQHTKRHSLRSLEPASLAKTEFQPRPGTAEDAAPTGLRICLADGTTNMPLLRSCPPSQNVSAFFTRWRF